MVSPHSVEQQLRAVGSSFQFWGRSEQRELSNILIPGEMIKECLNGHYEGGFAMLTATTQRIILVDRKPMNLTLEDIRYDMIAEIDYNHRLLNATIRVFTPTKTLSFTSRNHTKLRKLVNHAQQRVMEIRQYQQSPQHIPDPTYGAIPNPYIVPQQFATLPQPQPLPQHDNSHQYVYQQLYDQPAQQAISPVPATANDYNTNNFGTGFRAPINPFVRVALTTRRRSLRAKR